MKFTSFSGILLSLCMIILTAGASYPSERITGSQIKDAIVAQAVGAGIIVSPQTASHKVYYPCDKPLNIMPKGKNWKTVEVVCSSPFEWKINIRNVVNISQIDKSENGLVTNSEQNATKAKYIPKLKVPTRLKKIDRPEPYETSTHKTGEKKEVVNTSKSSTKTKLIKKEPLIRTARKDPPKLFQYFILNEPLNKGAIISNIDQLKTKLFNREVRGGYLDSSQIIGRELKVSIPAGQPILSRFLTTNYTVKKDSVLDLTLQRSGVKVTSQGRALSNGQLGEIILVSNLSSGIRLRAKIKNAHEAEIITKQLN